MILGLEILYFTVAFMVGLLIQYYLKCSPWLNLLLAFLTLLILPPFWGAGLTLGLWLCCSFITFRPNHDHYFENNPGLTWYKILSYALLTFSGFILTLIFLWKLKIFRIGNIGFREALAWPFLLMMEIFLYKIIARLAPVLYKIPLGYGIAVLNFLMILYWVYSLDPYSLILIFFSLLVISPLLLIWVDCSFNGSKKDFYSGRNG